MQIEKSWEKVLEKEMALSYFQELKFFLEEEKKEGKVIYPAEENMYQAFLHTPFDAVKLVIVGQDPYHGEGQAHGLSFSVEKGITMPPSLKNIFKELHADLQIPFPKTGNLSFWAQQGVFLLNATLTVRRGEPKSHFGKGWERFTDAVIESLAQKETPIVFLLWGKSAQEKGEKILSMNEHHLVLKAAHPSPYSAKGFFGCRHFSKANVFLEQTGQTPIDWCI
jgi:uracil-DNA glycosylase